MQGPNPTISNWYKMNTSNAKNILQMVYYGYGFMEIGSKDYIMNIPFLLKQDMLVSQNMNIISMFIPMMTMFLLTGVLSGIWPSASPIYAQNNNQTSAATIDQLASNLTFQLQHLHLQYTLEYLLHPQFVSGQLQQQAADIVTLPPLLIDQIDWYHQTCGFCQINWHCLSS